MAGFVKGDVVIVPFPFSDLTGSKRRPALVVADLRGDDLILCQITHKRSQDPYSITLDSSDFATGSLPLSTCYIKPQRLFTADNNIIFNSAGHINNNMIKQVNDKIIEIFSK